MGVAVTGKICDQICGKADLVWVMRLILESWNKIIRYAEGH